MTVWVAALLLAVLAPAAFGGADEEWQRIEALEQGPQVQTQGMSREQGRALALRHLDRQESAFRDFAARHPADARSVEAKLRLARLLAVRSDLQGNRKFAEESAALLRALETSAPPERAADIAFAKIVLSIRNTRPGDAAAQRDAVSQARSFQRSFPSDRRVAGLLAEVATLLDDRPKEQETMLRDAERLATSPELKSRVLDDLRRLERLGKVVDATFPSASGAEIDLAAYRGKVVVLCWFADWSPPSMLVLEALKESLSEFSPANVQAVGISLDESRPALAANLSRLKLGWPIAFDGKGWQSPAARSHGINSLPTVWLLDRRGRLRALNVYGDPNVAINTLLRER